ncbi:MAG: alpha/beta hydrolase family protein, partial [Anaerolineales bacterium]
MTIPAGAPRFPAGLDGVTFDSQGCKLLGGFYRAQGETLRPTVVLLHGIPGVEKNLDLASALRDASFNVLYFHYRGCWGSEGAYSISGQVADVHAATEWVLRQPCVDGNRLVLVGNSLGGYMALAAGAADTRFRERISAIVALCPLIDPTSDGLTHADFDEFVMMLNGVTGEELETQWRALTPITQMAAQLRGRSLMLVTSERDTLFPPEHYEPVKHALTVHNWVRFDEGDHALSLCRQPMI